MGPKMQRPEIQTKTCNKYTNIKPRSYKSDINQNVFIGINFKFQTEKWTLKYCDKVWIKIFRKT